MAPTPVWTREGVRPLEVAVDGVGDEQVRDEVHGLVWAARRRDRTATASGLEKPLPPRHNGRGRAALSFRPYGAGLRRKTRVSAPCMSTANSAEFAATLAPEETRSHRREAGS